MMTFSTYIQMAERTIIHEEAHIKPITYQHLDPYRRQDPKALFAPSLGFATSTEVVESVVSTLWAVGRVRLFLRPLHQSQILGGSYTVPSVGMLLDCPRVLQKLSPVPGAGSWETTPGPPAAEVLKVAYAVQALGLGAAPRSYLMVIELEWHCPVCWAGSAPGLPHLNHGPTQDCDVPCPSLLSLCRASFSSACYSWSDIIFFWTRFGAISAWMGKCFLHGDQRFLTEIHIGFYLVNHR